MHQSEPSTETWLPWQANNDLQRINARPSRGLGGLCQSLGVQNSTSTLQRPTGGRVHQGMCWEVTFPMETLGWQCRRVFVSVCFCQCKDSFAVLLAASQRGKCFVLASSIQNWGEGELSEGGPGERGEPNVPWWLGLGWGWWRRVCDPVTRLSLQSVCFII